MKHSFFIIQVGLSILFLILTFFGIIRLLSLHIYSPINYIETYKHLDQADDKSKVVISLITDTSNTKNIKPVLNSILDQTVKVNNIGLHITDKQNIPDDYKIFLNIYKLGRDYGVNNNIIPSLLRETETDTKIICLNPNYIYGKDLIETLVDESNKHPNKLICIGSNLNNYESILIKPEFFDPSILFDIELDNNSLKKDISKYIKCKIHKLNYKDNFKLFF